MVTLVTVGLAVQKLSFRVQDWQSLGSTSAGRGEVSWLRDFIPASRTLENGLFNPEEGVGLGDTGGVYDKGKKSYF